MSTISTKNIQMFIAGALAYMGFRDLIMLPYYAPARTEGFLMFHAVFSGLALVLGISMLFGKAKAFRLAEIYLGLSITVTLAIMTSSFFNPKAPHYGWKIIAALINPSVLFVPLVWSRHRRFQDESDAPEKQDAKVVDNQW